MQSVILYNSSTVEQTIFSSCFSYCLNLLCFPISLHDSQRICSGRLGVGFSSVGNQAPVCHLYCLSSYSRLLWTDRVCLCSCWLPWWVVGCSCNVFPGSTNVPSKNSHLTIIPHSNSVSVTICKLKSLLLV